MLDSIDPPSSIIGFLFQEGVIGDDEMRALRRIKDDPKQQCDELLSKLHASKNPQAFIQLYLAIKKESHLQWLIDLIDNVDRQTTIRLVQQQYTSEQAGEWLPVLKTKYVAYWVLYINIIYMLQAYSEIRYYR